VSRPTVPSNDNLATSLYSQDTWSWDADQLAAELAKARAAHDERAVVDILHQQDTAMLWQATIQLLESDR
jgi:hypothetical protein